MKNLLLNHKIHLQTRIKLYYTNGDVHRICNTRNVSDFIRTQQRNYAAHLVRADNQCMTKQLMFQDNKCTKRGKNTNTLLKQVLDNLEIGQTELHRKVEGSCILNRLRKSSVNFIKLWIKIFIISILTLTLYLPAIFEGICCFSCSNRGTIVSIFINIIHNVCL